MKLQRFFVKEQLYSGKEITIHDEEFAHQIMRVFRMKVGDPIVLLDNSGFEYDAEIAALGKKEITVSLLDKKESVNKPKLEVTLFASLIKKDKFEWVLEKATELGVSHVVPVVSERSEKKDLNIERAQKIVKEASEQSERGNIPTLSEPLSLLDAVTKVDFPVVAFHLSGEIFSEETYKAVSQLGIFVGPEGGWSERDLELFKEKKIPIVTLGSQVLRAETASIAALTKILL